MAAMKIAVLTNSNLGNFGEFITAQVYSHSKESTGTKPQFGACFGQ